MNSDEYKEKFDGSFYLIRRKSDSAVIGFYYPNDGEEFTPPALNQNTTGTAAGLSETLVVGSGGTGTDTEFTAGSIVFAGADGIYSQDNANFFWNDTDHRLGILTATPTSTIGFGGNAARVVAMERHTTADAPGASLTIQAGGAATGGTDRDAGYVILKGGVSTGTGVSGVVLQGAGPGSAGTSDNTPAAMVEVTGNKLGLFGVTPVVRPTALTAQLTTLTFTAPVTPDYALSDLTDTGGFGFSSKDEGNTVLSVIANLQTRISELESKLQGLGALT